MEYEYTEEEKQKYAERFPKIDRTIYGGYTWHYKYRLGKVLDLLGKEKLIKDFKSNFDNIEDQPTAATLNSLLESVNSQYRLFSYINNGRELWAIMN